MVESSGATSLHAARIARCALLSGAAANVLLLVAPSRAREPWGLDLAGFLRMSEKLTGRANLPPESARRYFQSIVGPAAPHRRGKAATRDGQAARDSRIVADWYSGQTIADKGMVCVDYAGALMWEAIRFAKPRGVPDAEAGRWALAPS
jgi:hypothetical protein